MKHKYIGSKTISRVNNVLGRKSPYKKKKKGRKSPYKKKKGRKDRALQI